MSPVFGGQSVVPWAIGHGGTIPPPVGTGFPVSHSHCSAEHSGFFHGIRGGGGGGYSGDMGAADGPSTHSQCHQKFVCFPPPHPPYLEALYTIPGSFFPVLFALQFRASKDILEGPCWTFLPSSLLSLSLISHGSWCPDNDRKRVKLALRREELLLPKQCPA